MAFRHQLIRQALYESMPTALRTALHAEAARALAATDADALSVAQQLFAAGQPGEGWARAWLIQTAPALTTRHRNSRPTCCGANWRRRQAAMRPGTG